jgi:hypothetical protein
MVLFAHLVAALALAAPADAVLDSPVALTSSDGEGLQLVAYDSDTVVAGPLAFTELRLTFENPVDRVIEGRFRIVLGDGAAVSRFAMKIDDRLQEGEVVEKQAARRAYEDALHRRQDPALLEQTSPNEFTARVFPIPARGTKELVVGVSQELSSSSTPLRIPLIGLPRVGNLRVRVRDGSGHTLASVQQTGVVPQADVVVAPSSTRTLAGDDVVVARVAVPVDAAPLPLEGALFLVDTSASRALGARTDRQLLDALFAALDPVAGKKHLVVMAFDQTQTVVYDGDVHGWSSAALAKRRALGASDLGAALNAAATLAKSRGLSRVVVVGDGIVTAGNDGDELVGRARALKDAGVVRLDAVAVGGLRDDALLRRLAQGTLAQDGAVIDGARGASEIARRLQQKTESGLVVDVDGARWVWPRRVDGAQPGDEVLVVAEVAPKTTPRVRLGGRVVDTGVVDTSAPAPLVRRAWAHAKIERLLDARERETKPEAKAELADQIVAVSTKHRVLSPLTALLVLETEADYARFGIDRKALADILVVDDGGLKLLHRTEVIVAPAPTPAERPKPADKAKKSAAREGEGEDLVSAEGEAEPASDDSRAADDGAERARDEGPAEDAKEEDAAPPPAMAAPPHAAAMADVVEREERAPARSAPSRARRPPPEPEPAPEPEQPKIAPYTGTFADVMALLAQGRFDDAVSRARGWREEAPGDLLALLALGEALEARGDVVEAARAYGSLIDLFAGRADIRRLAGARLDRLASRRGDDVAGVRDAAVLAEDTWRRAAVDRPDHPQGARGHAWALWRLHQYGEAFAVVERALLRDLPDGRFAGVPQILRDDLSLLGAAWAKADPAQKRDIDARLQKAGAQRSSSPSTRFVLWWETDANDVDFHIHDGKKNHAFYSAPELATGGALYADVTTGFGPECFTIPGRPRAYPYKLEAHYYSRGPMGFGMGSLRIVEHDGNGALLVQDRPFVIMADGAFVDLGTVTGPLSSTTGKAAATRQ